MVMSTGIGVFRALNPSLSEELVSAYQLRTSFNIFVFDVGLQRLLSDAVFAQVHTLRAAYFLPK